MLATLPLRWPAAWSAVPTGNLLVFDVMRFGGRIGTHILQFEPGGDGLRVHVAIDIVVRLALIPLFRYRQSVSEHWQRERLVQFEARTDNDGTAQEANGRLDAAGLVVEGSKTPRYVAPASALTTTYWNRKLLDGPMISTQDGRLFQPEITLLGVERLPMPSGTRVDAQHFALSGGLRINLWYAGTDWVGCAFTAKDGSTVSYALRGA
jgi:hypothetical protein